MPPSLADAEAVLRSRFGYAAFRPAQRRAILAVLAQRDVLAVMPTGGGKSLCFQVPALMRTGLTVVLSPLISLMKDQVDALVRRGLPAAGLHGGMTAGEQADALGRATRGEVKLLYVAPERLASGRALRALSRVEVSLLAVDEAHCISEWGHDFRPAYREMQSIRVPLGAPPIIALTATATPTVRDDIVAVCGLRRPVRVVSGFDRPNLRYSVRRVGRTDERNRCLRGLLRVRCGSAVVYAQTRNRVERIAKALAASGVSAAAYHAGQPAALRRRTQDGFMTGDVQAIVATSAFGMGVDKPDVRIVVHDAISPSLESYYQEAGRAGRDGESSECVLLYARADRRSPEYFIAASSPSRGIVRAAYEGAVRMSAACPTGGAAWIDVGALAARLKRPATLVRGALSILQRGGAVVEEQGDRDSAWVRVLATEGRAGDLLAGDPLRRDFLRELWRMSAGGVRSGAVVDLTALPPGLGGEHAGRLLDSLTRECILVWERPQAGLRLADVRVPLEAWPVDWAALEHRREVAERRLSAMVRYAESRGCRREVLLRYFGEEDVAVPCGGCDRCT